MTHKTLKFNKLALLVGSLIAASSSAFAVETEIGDFNADLRLRYEGVDEANTKTDAEALTLRTLLTFKSKEVNGFSGLLQIEDNHVFINNYNNTLGKNTRYSVVADPNSTELDQGFIQYRYEGYKAKVGRQVITMDNHRFVGHVGWRQDKQTFDAVSFSAKQDDWTFDYAYIDQRNRIFADEKDIDSSDHLFNASYKIQSGKITAYGYMLENDDLDDNSLDTYGIRYAGKFDKFLVQAEYATQDNEMALSDYSADYLFLEGGYKFDTVTAKLGYEVLGSDNGAYGFSTPLATLHKFNGWADVFLATPADGLQDLYASFSGKALGGKWLVAYHNFTADESSSADDYGREFDIQYTRKLSNHFTGGIKFAMYTEGDANTAKDTVDTDKLWLWLQAKF